MLHLGRGDSRVGRFRHRVFHLVARSEGAEAPEAPAEAAAEPLEEAPAVDEAPEDVEAAFSTEELQALIAPVALYPDLVLVLALQATLAPLDVVQADRFLAQYAEDPSLEPDPDWDESVIGLLNYPTVARTMSEDLDWTETVGTAVITQLEGIQDAIQEFRAFMRAVGALESNDQVTVIAEGDIIRIEPTDETAVFIPQYDPDALLAALYSADVDLEPETGAEAVAEPEGEAVEDYPDEEMIDTAEMRGGTSRRGCPDGGNRAGRGAGLLPSRRAAAGHLFRPLAVVARHGRHLRRRRRGRRSRGLGDRRRR